MKLKRGRHFVAAAYSLPEGDRPLSVGCWLASGVRGLSMGGGVSIQPSG